MPTRLSETRLNAAIEWVETNLAPAPQKAWDAVTDKLTVFTMSFINVPTEALAGALSIYRAALGHLPTDLLVLAAGRAMRNWRWHNAMPTPAEIEETVIEEMSARRHLQIKLKVVKSAMAKEAVGRDQARKTAADDAWWEAAAKRQGKTVEQLKAEAAAIRARRDAGGPLFEDKPEAGITPEREALRAAIQGALKTLAETPKEPVDKDVL